MPGSAAREALRQRRRFSAIESARATKVDLIVRKARAFSEEGLSRRRQVDLAFAEAVSVVSPEDAILSKLEWARRGGDSERQLRDAAGVLEVTSDVDRRYIERWARQLAWRISGSGSRARAADQSIPVEPDPSRLCGHLHVEILMASFAEMSDVLLVGVLEGG